MTLPSVPGAITGAAGRSSVLSGVTPSGFLTLGNYLGALRRFASGQDTARCGYFFVADLHAMTVPHEPERLRRMTIETAALFFASGLDAARSTVFVQSHVAAHVALSYLLESTAYVGELARMVQFKDKGGRPGTRASLFTYPCLMAADILLYDTEDVPVGGDQDQHVELCRDIAVRFNRLYGETFVVPRVCRAALASRVRDLNDPQVKMSKSAADSAAGVIRLLDPPDVVRRKIARAVTDSDGDVRYDPDGKPGVSNLLEIIAALSGDDPAVLAGGFDGCGRLKAACTDCIIATLTPLQQRYSAIVSDEQELAALLHDGAERARHQADQVLSRARRAVGLTPSY